MVWATFWAIFSETNPVTLVLVDGVRWVPQVAARQRKKRGWGWTDENVFVQVSVHFDVKIRTV
jgi:hypothetical protein